MTPLFGQIYLVLKRSDLLHNQVSSQIVLYIDRIHSIQRISFSQRILFSPFFPKFRFAPFFSVGKSTKPRLDGKERKVYFGAYYIYIYVYACKVKDG